MAGLEPDSSSNLHTRSIAFFASYFALCVALLFLCLSTIRFRNFSRARGSWTFTVLTLASLGSTWYYMIAFFLKSYSDWELSEGPSADGAIQLGPWLKDVKLFEQAWSTVVADPARWWWSQQILLATCGWTVFLAAEGEFAVILSLASAHVNRFAPWDQVFMGFYGARPSRRDIVRRESVLSGYRPSRRFPYSSS